jgi:hypothetical protein
MGQKLHIASHTALTVVMQSNHDHRDGSSGGVYAAIVTA